MPGTEQVDIQWAHRIGLFVFSLFLLILVLELVRRGFLKERYALLWLATSAVGLVIGAAPGIIVLLSSVFHFQYLTVIVVTSLVFILGLVLSFSVVLSRLAERNRRLTQELALLTHELKKLEKRVER